jgi:hypothetical protein
MIACHQRAFEIPNYWGQRAREAAVALEYGQWNDLMTGKLSSGTYIITPCYGR